MTTRSSASPSLFLLPPSSSRADSLLDHRYDFLIVAPGLKINFDAVKGLKEGLADPTSAVSSIYSLDTVEKTWRNIEAFKKGTAVRPPLPCSGDRLERFSPPRATSSS